MASSDASIPAGRTIAVTLIEDAPEIRKGLALLIHRAAGFRCQADYGSMEEALPRIGPPLPDVVLVDIGLPGMSGIDGIRLLKERFPPLLLLVLSVYEDDRRIFDAFCAGATGYLLKKTQPGRLLEGIREAVAGGSPISPQVARRVIALFRDFRPPDEGEGRLTPHEVRLLKLLADGHQYKTAAAQLGVSPSTINYHLQSIYAKLHVHSKSEAVAKALRSGLLR